MKTLQEQAASFLENYPEFNTINTPAVRKAYNETIEQIIHDFLRDSGLSFLITNESVLVGIRKGFHEMVNASATRTYYVVRHYVSNKLFGGFDSHNLPLWGTSTVIMYKELEKAEEIEHILFLDYPTDIIPVTF